jgi:hypothetical protein
VEGLRPMATRLPTFIPMRRPVRPSSASVLRAAFLNRFGERSIWLSGGSACASTLGGLLLCDISGSRFSPHRRRPL